MQYWQAMLIQEFEEFLRQESSTSTCSSLSCHVTSPADHFPSTLTLHCPAQWHELLKKTFLDTKIFRQCVQPSNQVLKNIQYSLPEWIKNTYSWGLDFKNYRLSTGYILPKPSRQWQKARPIVNYSKAWPWKLGAALSVVLTGILQTVYASILHYRDVHAVLSGIQQLFCRVDLATEDYHLAQTDIAGFYNQVEHNRICGAIEFAVSRYANMNCPDGLDTIMQAHTQKLERTCVFFKAGTDRTPPSMYQSN